MPRKPRVRQRSLRCDVGSLVEVRSTMIELQDAWFEAIITRKLAECYTVSYSSLIAGDVPLNHLKQKVYPSLLRPRPPPPDPNAVFGLHQFVEAFHTNGWWKGVVISLPERGGDGSYLVCFPARRAELRFKSAELRRRMQWINGEWIAVEDDDQVI